MNADPANPAVLISAYTCCPGRGSEPGNGWNWILGYVNAGYVVTVVTSDLYRDQIEAHLASQDSLSQRLTIHFCPIGFWRFLRKTPVIGLHMDAILWARAARRIVLELESRLAFKHAHHVTYNSIAFGTPLHGLRVPVVLGPLGGSAFPHPTLWRYLGSGLAAEFAKRLVSTALLRFSGNVRASVRSSRLVLYSNEAAKRTVERLGAGSLKQMFDAGLSENFRSNPIRKRTTPTFEILWVGRMLPRKGVDLAIRALARLPARVAFRATFVGDGPCRRSAMALAEKLGLGDRARFPGHVSHQATSDFYREADVFLFPSLMDSCPMQVFEAMAFSNPVVSLQHQGMVEQVDRSRGILVPVGWGEDYPQTLAEALTALHDDPEKHQRLAEEARKFAQSQLWSERIPAFLRSLAYNL